MRKRLVLAGAVLLIVGVVAGPGCRRDRLNTVLATGTVTFRGKPVEAAMVAFSPKTEGIRSAVGITDSQGRFQLMTLYSGDGAMPGAYTVTIVKTGPPVAPIDTSFQAAVEREQKASRAANAEATVDPKTLLPAKYRDAQTSGLTAEVKPQGGNQFTFELTE